MFQFVRLFYSLDPNASYSHPQLYLVMSTCDQVCPDSTSWQRANDAANRTHILLGPIHWFLGFQHRHITTATGPRQTLFNKKSVLVDLEPGVLMDSARSQPSLFWARLGYII